MIIPQSDRWELGSLYYSSDKKRKRKPWDANKREMIFTRDKRECYYCGSKTHLSLDHIVPIQSGGSDVAANIVTSCQSCNSSKNGNELLLRFAWKTISDVNDRNIACGIDPAMEITRDKARLALDKAREDIGREMKRAGDFKGRIESVSDRRLYEITIFDDRDMKRLRESAYRNGYEYLSVPTGNDKEKLVIIDGRVKGSKPIHPNDAVSKLKNLAGVVYNDRSVRASGTLGSNFIV